MFISDNKLKNHSFRTYRNLKSWYISNKRFKQLTIGFKKSYGRSNNGKITVFSKGKLFSRTIVNIMSSSFRGFFFFSFLSQIKFDIRKNSIVGLFNNSIGCWFHSLLPVNFFIFDYIKIYSSSFNKKMNLITENWPRCLFDMPLHSKICSIEFVSDYGVSSGIKLVKSAGSRGLLLDNKYRGKYSIVVLPSFKIKIINSNSFAFLNYIENELKKYLKSNKAGFYVRNGRKPTVRGIVKNPCDHPNGGRARTILLSRTPWGKVAKKSRKQSLVKKLKSLSKRLSGKQKKQGTYVNSVSNIFNDTSAVKYISKTLTEILVFSKN